MKNLIIVAFLGISIQAFPQDTLNASLYVKYQEKGDGNFVLNQWFLPDRTIFSKTFSHVPDMKQQITKYNKEAMSSLDSIQQEAIFIETQKALSEAMKKRSVTIRYYNSDVLHKSLYDLEFNKFYVIDTLKKMSDWKILPDTMTILGYKCQKALTTSGGNEFYAWFTTDLPFLGGPKTIRGLPGLILLAGCDALNLKTEAVELQYPAINPLPDTKMNGKRISQSEFEALVESQNKRIR